MALEHNKTMGTWMDWIQRHIEYVYGSALHELDGEASTRFSTERRSEQGLQQLGTENLNYVTGRSRGDRDRMYHIPMDRVTESSMQRFRPGATAHQLRARAVSA